MDYDVRYLGGIRFFNEEDFFEAHEVWEDLWMNCAGPERRFYQGLIQAAVALYHFGNGNLRGAVKLYHSSRAYLEPFGPAYLGLDVHAFQEQMDRCFREALDKSITAGVELREERIPRITLDPPPETWPELAQFQEQDGD
jgi:predicted metal-dependent hydrolase